MAVGLQAAAHATAALDTVIGRTATAVPAVATAETRAIFLLNFTGNSEGGAGVRDQGRVVRCGSTVAAQLLPLVTSQLIDQVIAPRMPG
ncbi:hypothetical protein Ate01nite_07050 [Actinoplanes teichomyceticus]|nr:hypothetical protein Ate01nite_07050 [Actinoplanes teichomyceticus]